MIKSINKKQRRVLCCRGCRRTKGVLTTDERTVRGRIRSVRKKHTPREKARLTTDLVTTCRHTAVHRDETRRGTSAGDGNTEHEGGEVMVRGKVGVEG